jgi:tetratricopeptide (TPR) repeat protein
MERGPGEPLRQAAVFGIPRNLLVEKIPFFLLSAVLSVITFFAQKSGGALVKSAGMRSQIENCLVGYLGYLQKLFWPQDLAVLYLRPPTVPISSLVFAVLILLAVTAAAGASRRRLPYLTVGWLWFLGMLLPVSGLIQTGLQSIADRYTYLPSIGLFVTLAWAATELAALFFPQRARRWLLTATAAVALCACAVLTRQQLAYWRDTETLMGRALQIDPNNYIAHSNLGFYYSRLGRTAEARIHYQRAGELDPALAKTPKKNNAP